ncbi:MFS transporter, partial [Aquibium sp. A9E412]|uniref:MFS transporter n=1 Tax=Aquibium sp. A9E412 TaxID=2976767 RepID=UPI0025B122FB
MTPFCKLSAAGFAATAITFGPARMGFGLFLPELRSTFSFSAGTAGLISGLGFSGFVLGLVAAAVLTARHGARVPVTAGLIAAALGLGIASMAASLPVLVVGVFLAMASAGMAWTPFNHAVHLQVADARRPGALSIVSTGTSLGVAAAGATALVLTAAGLS